MPTSSKVRDYTMDLPTAAPDYLRDWAEKRKWSEHALIWSADGWKVGPTGEREKCANVACTACGERFKMDYLPGNSCGAYNGYAPRLLDADGKAKRDYAAIRCPRCGKTVTVTHVHGSLYAKECAWPMTLHRIQEPEKADRLALILWRVYKAHDREGARSITYMPWEAYIVEENQIRRCTKHAGGIGGSYPLAEWMQSRQLIDTMQDIADTVCPEGIGAATEGTTAENAKLDIYMKACVPAFPVPYLRLWQRHPNVETLLTTGAGAILGVLIGQEKKSMGYTHEWNVNLTKLDCIHWLEKRPGRMLGMDRGMLREAVALQHSKNLGGATWTIWLRRNFAGAGWGLDQLEQIEKLMIEMPIVDLYEMTWRGKPARISTYLEAQRRRRKNDYPGLRMLVDYWNMAERLGENLADPEVLWPERLKLAHDRVVERMTAIRTEKAAADAAKRAAALEEKMQHRADVLGRYSFACGGLMIRPPLSAEELAEEGRKLHHCVQTYTNRHAGGATAILFIRREDDPDTPYFTLNLDEKELTVIQNRGDRNCDRTPEVKAFEKVWVAWIKAGAKRDKDGRPILPGEKKTRRKNAA